MVAVSAESFVYSAKAAGVAPRWIVANLPIWVRLGNLELLDGPGERGVSPGLAHRRE